jgi:uncharacterized protein (DUF885 family)
MVMKLGRAAGVLLLAATAGVAALAGSPPPVDVDRLAADFQAHVAAARALPPSEAQARADSAWAAGVLDRLHEIDPAALTHDRWITYATLEYDAGLIKDAAEFYWLDTPVTPYASLDLSGGFAARPLTTEAELQAYLDAVHAFPVRLRAYEAKLRGQVERGIVLPAAEIDLVVPFLRGFAGADGPLHVTDGRLSRIPADARARFVEAVGAAIRDEVAPAVERLAGYIDGPYRQRATADVGVSRLPGGRRYYEYLIRRHTGLALTPEQIHQVGVEEVARLESELDEVRQQVQFAGDLAAFHEYLRNDPRFRAKSSDDIGERMMAAIRRIEPKVDAYFSEKPKAPYGVRALDAQRAASMTYGYYQVPVPTDPSGYYMFNGTNPGQRSVLMAEATIYHELVPGHHFQIALQMENPALIPYRRATLPTAFIEGWGEYASDLAGEMGMYSDPWQRAGRLAMDLFVSTRLVVDTGMNALGWPRDRAIAYMKAHTFESDLQIGTETLRYSADIPAQALAYKLGARHIRELRDRAARAQGSAFDIRSFHRHLLGSGAMPLGVLDGHVDCFLHERHAGR